MQRGREVVLEALGGALHVAERGRARAATPLTLAVIDSKIRCRSRDRIVSAATDGHPEQPPRRTNAATTTVGVPRPRRLTMPVSPPM